MVFCLYCQVLTRFVNHLFRFNFVLEWMNGQRNELILLSFSFFCDIYLKVQSDDQISTLSVTAPNKKEICQNKDIDTPEKMSLLKNRAKRVFQSVSDVCDQKRESLASVLGNMCAFKD